QAGAGDRGVRSRPPRPRGRGPAGRPAGGDQNVNRYAVMCPGGKDSALAPDRARRSGRAIACLPNFYDQESRRLRVHATPPELVATGGRAVITCCEAAKVDESWLGRIVDEHFARDIQNVPIDPCGENGEYHSFAFAGPLFARPVRWSAGETRSDGRFAQLDLV